MTKKQESNKLHHKKKLNFTFFAPSLIEPVFYTREAVEKKINMKCNIKKAANLITFKQCRLEFSMWNIQKKKQVDG